MSSSRSHPFRNFTTAPFEIFILVFTILPFCVLLYFYSALPERVPLFMNLNGEVATWGEKSVISVLRVPLMAAVTQIVLVLMKYGTLHSSAVTPLETTVQQATLLEKYLVLNSRLWDWFRWTAAFKMSAESLNTIFLSLERFNFLARPTFIFSAIAALVGAVGALIYGYRLLVVRRELKDRFGDAYLVNSVDAQRVYGGVFYFNPSDAALFVTRHIFNLGNKWAWVFIACLIAYPLLVFLA